MTTKTCLLFAPLFAVCAFAEEPFRISQVTPADKAADVSPSSAVQAHVSRRFDAATLTADAARLLGPGGEVVAAKIAGDLGGVITLSPDAPLEPETEYRVEISDRIRALDGAKLEPFRSAFRTGKKETRAETTLPRFRAEKLDAPTGATAVTFAPDGRLYVATWDGEIYRYEVDAATGRTGERRTVWKKEGARILTLEPEPGTAAGGMKLWISYDSRGGHSVADVAFCGVVSRLTWTGDDEAREEKFIVGLPNGDHPVSQCVFGPDRRLYLPVGAMTMLGHGPPERSETPISATVLVADVLDPDFNGGKLPVDVTTAAPVSYDAIAADAPVRIFASGIRQAYDLCWHSNGQLYAGVNMNDTGSWSAATDGVPALSVRPDEPLIRIVEGAYYGQPNPAMEKFVIQGGNPTEEKDPWEIPEYPVGVKPDEDFDPDLLIYNLAPIGGPSANGCAEWRAGGPLDGRLLICFYTSARTIHTFAFSDDGKRVEKEEPILGTDGDPLKFGAPLDLAIDQKNGRIYVVDFADSRRGDSAKEGALWLVEPVPPQ